MVAEFVEASTEARWGLVTFEATHRPVSSLDPAMVLFDSVVQILISPMFYTRIQFSPDRAWVTVVAVRRDTRGSDAGHRFGRSEERLGCRHVALLAQPDVDNGARTIDGTIKITPSTVHLNVCLVNVPALADPPCTPPPEVIDEGRRQLRLPIANRLVAEFDAPDQEHLWQIAQAQLVAKPPENHECDDVGWIMSAIENSTTAFIELLHTGAAAEVSVPPGSPLTSFRHVRRVTLYALHGTVLHPGRIIARRAFTQPANPGATGDRTVLDHSPFPSRLQAFPVGSLELA